MKKSLIALATLAAVSGTAFAQSSVTLYGVVDMGYNTDKKSTGTTVNAKTAGIGAIQSGSRLGFKGTEDLGGGLKANFTVEMGIDPTEARLDSATSGLANRQSFIGLEGGFGVVNIGRQYTLIHGVQGAMDPNGNATAAGWLAGLTNSVRADDMVAYTTPSFSGFTATLGMGLAGSETSTAAGATKAGDVTTIAAAYTNGPLTVRAATETIKKTALSVTVPGGIAASALSDALTDRKATSIGASYDLGVAKVSYLNTSAKAGSAADNAKATSNNFGVTVPMGALTLGASLSNGKITDTGTTVGKANGYQLGASYALSKRTNAYAFLGEAKSKPTGNAAANGKHSTMAFGLRHTF
jgi:predicted porin